MFEFMQWSGGVGMGAIHPGDAWDGTSGHYAYQSGYSSYEEDNSTFYRDGWFIRREQQESHSCCGPVVGGSGYWSGRALAHGRKHKNYNVTRHKYDSRSNGEQCCHQVEQETATTPHKPVEEFTCCDEWYVHYSAGERCCNGTATETRHRNVTSAGSDAYQHVIGYIASGVYWSHDTYRQLIGHKGAGMVYGEWSAATANGLVPRESDKNPLVCCDGLYSSVGDRCCGRKNYTL